MRGVTLLPGLLALALSVPVVAHANPNLVQNGNFSSTIGPVTHNDEFGTATGTDAGGSGQTYGGNFISNWTGGVGYNLYFIGGTATTVSAYSQYGGPQQLNNNFTQLGGGGNFVALDGDQTANGPITQSISGLTAGQVYALSFNWGATQLSNRTGTITDQLQISLGSQTLSTNVLTEVAGGDGHAAFSGWLSTTLDFTAASSTEVLSFLSVGTPTGLPPMAVLDNVSLVLVPEPAAFALLGVGLVALGATQIRRRRRQTA